MLVLNDPPARAIYAGLDTTTCVCILRRAALGLGRRPGSEKLATLQTTRLLERDFGTDPDAALAALLLLGKKGPGAGAKAAAEVLFRFKTKGTTSGSEKWQKRQEAAGEVAAALNALDAAFAAQVADELAKKMK